MNEQIFHSEYDLEQIIEGILNVNNNGNRTE
jgi:hypothetical protein